MNTTWTQVNQMFLGKLKNMQQILLRNAIALIGIQLCKGPFEVTRHRSSNYIKNTHLHEMERATVSGV